MSTEKKADFSGVTSKFESTEEVIPTADFSGVTSKFESTEEIIVDGSDAATYTVAKGDTLSTIAKNHYGKASAWRAVFEANRDTIEDPDRIFPGQVIKLPKLPEQG